MQGNSPQDFNTPDLRALSIQARVQSVHSRVLLAFTYCRLVRTELSYEQFEDARKLLHAIEETIDSLRQNLANASDLPSEIKNEITLEVDRLQLEFARIKDEVEGASQRPSKVT
jgi:archaellum component FlaC